MHVCMYVLNDCYMLNITRLFKFTSLIGFYDMIYCTYINSLSNNCHCNDISFWEKISFHFDSQSVREWVYVLVRKRILKIESKMPKRKEVVGKAQWFKKTKICK